ncbi:hypothetical protein EDB85DRAFT_1384635 [Lactarius pseudohatsudake]|nr:hypothetical protein EDB85DRAFT_1384635 [Lactarius pseudohatsudake]
MSVPRPSRHSSPPLSANLFDTACPGPRAFIERTYSYSSAYPWQRRRSSGPQDHRTTPGSRNAAIESSTKGPSRLSSPLPARGATFKGIAPSCLNLKAIGLPARDAGIVPVHRRRPQGHRARRRGRPQSGATSAAAHPSPSNRRPPAMVRFIFVHEFGLSHRPPTNRTDRLRASEGAPPRRPPTPVFPTRPRPS